MTMNTLKVADAQAAIKHGAGSEQGQGRAARRRDASSTRHAGGRPRRPHRRRRRRSHPTSRRCSTRGARSTREVCFACHGDDGRGARSAGLGERTHGAAARGFAARARSLGLRDQGAAARAHRSARRHHLSRRDDPDGACNTDEWIAAIASYVRNSFGNRAALDRAGRRRAGARGDGARKTPWHVSRARCVRSATWSLPESWKLTASHNAQTAGDATTSSPGPRDVRRSRHVGADRAAAAGDAGRASSSSRRRRSTTPASPARRHAPASAAAAAAVRSPSPRSRAATTVVVSMPTARRGAPRRQGQGKGVVNEIAFTPTRAKFVRIRQTGSADNAPWTIGV